MDRVPLARDTALEAEAVQLALWREMAPGDKMAIISGLCQAARDLALAGIRSRYPDASPRECFLRLAALTLGDDLARRAYPELTRFSALP